jgi:hypothetical protein
VVPDAAALSVAQIAGRLTEYRRLAERGAFRKEQRLVNGRDAALFLHAIRDCREATSRSEPAPQP